MLWKVKCNQYMIMWMQTKEIVKIKESLPRVMFSHLLVVQYHGFLV